MRGQRPLQNVLVAAVPLARLLDLDARSVGAVGARGRIDRAGVGGDGGAVGGHVGAGRGLTELQLGGLGRMDADHARRGRGRKVGKGVKGGGEDVGWLRVRGIIHRRIGPVVRRMRHGREVAGG